MNEFPLAEKIHNAVAGLDTARKEADKVRSDYNEAFEKFKEQNKDLIAKLVSVGASLDTADKTLRDLTLEEWNRRCACVTPAFPEKPDKQIVPGVEIKMRTVVKYNPTTAFNWAIDHKLALQLDKVVFETTMRNFHRLESAVPEFVEFEEQPVPYIAVDFSKVKAG